MTYMETRGERLSRRICISVGHCEQSIPMAAAGVESGSLCLDLRRKNLDYVRTRAQVCVESAQRREEDGMIYTLY